SFFLLKAQNTVHVNGKIVDFNPAETYYLSNGEFGVPLELSADGSFEVDMSYNELPAFLNFKKYTKGGNRVHLVPRIWFESNSIDLTINMASSSFETQKVMPYQEISERIEALKGKSQNDFLIKNPNHWPSLYFADRNKTEMRLADLEDMLQRIEEKYKNSAYIKRIESYVMAKRISPAKKGKKVADFFLKDKNGKDIPLLENKDKTKLIALFTSGCSYSIASIDLLAKINEMSNDKIEIITIWEDDSKSSWLNGSKEEKEKITWTSLWDETGFAANYLNRKLWPSFYVINSEGILVDKFQGYTQKTADKLKELVE
ncbi:MAG: TlpA disulfide reductase family protein, partial [Bacteroidota bacterium]